MVSRAITSTGTVERRWRRSTRTDSLVGLAYLPGFQRSNILFGFYTAMKSLNHQIVCLVVGLSYISKCKNFLVLEGGKGLYFCFSFFPPLRKREF